MRKTLALALITAAFAVTSAKAQSVTYDLTGTFDDSPLPSVLTTPSGTFDLRFVLPQSPTLSGNPTDSLTLAPSSVSYFLNGQSVALSGSEFGFLDLTLGGGLEGLIQASTASLDFSLGGSSLFTGTTNNPVFQTGSFQVSGNIVLTVNTAGTVDGLLNVSNLSLTGVTQPNVPEPSTTATLFTLSGLALGAVTVRRFRRQVA